jgi:hypothetical protein
VDHARGGRADRRQYIRDARLDDDRSRDDAEHGGDVGRRIETHGLVGAQPGRGAGLRFGSQFQCGRKLSTLATNVQAAGATTGSILVAIPPTVTSQALIRASPAGVPDDGDVSNVTFRVVAPAVTVSAPNTNVTSNVGSNRAINWSHNLGVAESVDVEISRDGGATWAAISTLAISANTSGTFTWVVTGPTNYPGADPSQLDITPDRPGHQRRRLQDSLSDPEAGGAGVSGASCCDARERDVTPGRSVPGVMNGVVDHVTVRRISAVTRGVQRRPRVSWADRARGRHENAQGMRTRVAKSL